jgi:glycosyltransferase involved in cell wall biosynthesis
MDALYVCYWSLRDPLCQSQTLPVLTGLAAEGRRFGLLTFEQPPWARSPAEDRAMEVELKKVGICWRHLRYHKRPRGLATALDVLNGTRVAVGVGFRGGARLFHGRGTVPAAIAYLAARLTGRLFFNDADGPLAQEYVDAGIWPAGSLLHRLTARAEARFLSAADAVAVLSEPRRREVASRCRHPPVVLPCAVDTRLFRPDPRGRLERRAELGLTGTVLVYAGKAGGWYATAEMFAFAEEARRALDPLTLLVLSTDPPQKFPSARGLPVVHRRARREEMPAYLSAADAALSFIRPLPSKAACSPVKNAEYLACGLPIVTTAGIGDHSALLETTRTGVVVSDLGPEGYRSAAVALRSLLEDPALAERCRATAERNLSLEGVLLPRYREIYARLLPARS